MRTARCLLLCLSFACLQAQAVVVENLYRAQVDVEDHGRSELQRATREGLAQVLVKVSGTAAVLQMPEIEAALDQAPNLMQRYRYLRPEEGGLRFQVHFDAQLVNDLLRDAQAPLWTANRPPVLVWMVVSDENGRRPATAEANPEFFQQIEQSLDRRGVPAVFPLNDLEDTVAVSVEGLWALDEGAILRASERYGVANVLAGRIRAMPDGRWLGDWRYLAGGQSLGTSFYGEEVPEFTASVVDFVADRMAGRYAVAGDNKALEVLVRVDALADFGELRRVLDYFQSIELVNAAWPAYLEGDSVVFRLAAQAEPDQLARIIQLNRRLQPLDAPESLRRGPINLDLVYQWNP